MIYKIEVEEILQDVWRIEADNLEEALDKAEDMYYNKNFQLYSEDLKETNFREYREERRNAH